MKCYLGWCSRFAVVLATLLLFGGNSVLARDAVPTGSTSLPAQTDVDRAKHLVDDKGVPLLKIAGIGDQRHPAWVAIYALAYAGVETYDPKLAGLENAEKFNACITWLEQNLKQRPNGLWVWEYGFDSTYNDISIKAPWSSAFAQATGIQAFLVAYKKTGSDKYLALANQAAKSLFMPLNQGGFLFKAGDDVWFEEIPLPVDNPGHILNGHMRALLALKELFDASGDTTIANWLKRGTDTLYRWLPRYDTGYWLRYDLNPQKKDLLFRFANPYGFPSHPLAIDKISLRDPVGNKEIVLDVGVQGDAGGATRIAGTHWGQIESLAGKTVRRLAPAALEGKPDEMGAPHSYFYLALPSEWNDNLRDQWYEMVVEYYDDAPANISVQQRSISPGPTFRDMRDGDLHLTGAGQWRKWNVPLRVTDLGYWVGMSYADKHSRYIAKIAESDKRFLNWAGVAHAYQNAIPDKVINGQQVAAQPIGLPKQTPVQPIFDLDANGVVRQFDSSASKIGQYHLFMIADQLLTAGDAIPLNAAMHFKKEQLRRAPALNWLTDSKNYREIDGAAVYEFLFDNAYNDVVTKAPWASAFGQIYVLKAFVHAANNEFSKHPALASNITKAANAFTVPVNRGGIAFRDRNREVWYEEVPNSTHVLNAHLVSVPELSKTARFLKAPPIQVLADEGVQSLRNKLHLFDTGYWLRYDQNPKKELLLQIDWLEGGSSPLIDEVLLQNPKTGRYVRLDVATPGDAEGGSRISGSEWQAEETFDGKTVRGFKNGYLLRASPVSGGTRHNVYLVLQLPVRDYADYFDVPAHKLIIRYKDVGKGRFSIKSQAIHQGNQLTFAPLRGGVWSTAGDQRWKEAVFTIRPQDLGWYKGPDYQVYEVQQLRRIADLTNDWFFSQYAVRQEYFLESQKSGRSVIAEPAHGKAKPPVRLVLRKGSPTYPGFGFANALDGDPNNDYVAGIEGEVEALAEFEFEPASPTELRLTWESPSNFARVVKVYAKHASGKGEVLIGEGTTSNGTMTRIPLRPPADIKFIRVRFSQFSGQNRLLLRQLEVQ